MEPWEVGQQRISVEGDFPSMEATWPQISDKRFDPISMLDSDDEDDVLDALVGSWEFDDEWDWGAEHSEDTAAVSRDHAVSGTWSA